MAKDGNVYSWGYADGFKEPATPEEALIWAKNNLSHGKVIPLSELLSDEITKFLEQYAVKPAHLEGAYNGPDPSCLEYAAEQLRKDGFVNRVPFSEWSSGCYKPYTSKEGREQHESILNQIKKFVKK